MESPILKTENSKVRGAAIMNPENILRDLNLKGGQVVADFGSGPGPFALPAAKMVGSKGKVYAVDVLESALEALMGRAKLEGLEKVINPVRADLEVLGSTGIPEKSADLVIMALILHQAKPDQVIAEAKRVLKPGGKIFIAEWESFATPIGPPSAERIPKEKVKEEMAKQGFKLVKEFQAGGYHYALIYE